MQSVTVEVAPGKRLAVIGRNGSGKSSLIDLLYGFRKPTSGVITVDGIDMRDLHVDSLREHIALVRGTEIFEGTVLENVRVGRPDVSLRDVQDALEAVGLEEEIHALPEGLETRLGTGAPELSYGQARRIAMARAIAGRPRLILLDESLDGLDEVAESKVRRTLFDRSAPWTVIMTTHDRHTLQSADDIYVLDQTKLRAMRSDDLEKFV